MTKTLVLGLGNPILGDDGVGWHVVAALQGSVHHAPTGADVELDCHVGGGLSLMERLVGYDRVIVVDAINLGQGSTGSVICCPLAALPNPAVGHLASAHETNLATALQLGRKVGAHLPETVMVVAVESPHVYEFAETLTPSVAGAVPQAAQRVLDTLRQWGVAGDTILRPLQDRSGG
jgi:hydrogenase maturation protease